MKNKIVVIGDIHGHFVQLMEMVDLLLLEGISFSKDKIVLLGDYLDGGPQVKQVLDWCIKMKKKYPKTFIPLFGNHESLFLDAFNPKHPIYGDYYLWYNQGGEETLKSFKPPQSFGYTDYELSLMQPEDLITKKYVDFIKNLDIYYETEDYFFVHGGLHPHLSIKEHKKLLKYITPETIREGDIGYDMIWMREPFISSTNDWGKKIIFGHTIDYNGKYNNGEKLKPIIKENKIGLDTFAHNVGYLSAVILPEEKIITTKWNDDAS